MASSIRWLDRSQPSTLVNATILCYINAVLSLLTGSVGNPIWFLVVAGEAVGAVAMANEKAWGYWVAVAASVLAVLIFLGIHSFSVILNLLFAVVLVALLLHPDSRGYRKTYFH